ncbi:hypothetical protein V1477_002907 [Vespula maculifrons]|uniref:Uncharacterized protein n=1 Tax=Vespula maculifrons TaxID=7453 RepID=A0ABD2CUN0_VESMC
MSEADGVDGGAICKRGFIHLQFAEKSEAPEAERHLDRGFQSRDPVISLGWDPWDGPMGVGFCAGLLSASKNPAQFSYSGFGWV